MASKMIFSVLLPLVIYILCVSAIGKEDDTPDDYDYSDDFDDMSEYEQMMRSKRETGWEDEDYGDYEGDYDEDDLGDYDDEPDSGEEEEEEPDEDYVDGKPITNNIADKDDKIKHEL